MSACAILTRSSADAWLAALLPIGPARSRTAKSSNTALSVIPTAPFGVGRHAPAVAALRPLPAPPLVPPPADCPPVLDAVPPAALALACGTALPAPAVPAGPPATA